MPVETCLQCAGSADAVRSAQKLVVPNGLGEFVCASFCGFCEVRELIAAGVQQSALREDKRSSS